MANAKIIAFYLPQYHPTADNNKWWGKGFTEWTNVGKAKPLYPGHYQPKIPADLGYYDLRLPQVREEQANLAKEAGIYGFCYYHYWFGNGKEELELPFNEVLASGKPDFPFMLCWANESWHKKFWDKDGKGSSKQVLVEQLYPGEHDIVEHFNRLLPAFKDPRYIRIDGKPAFMIYKPHALPHATEFIKKWNELAIDQGLGGIYFIAHMQSLGEQGLDSELSCEKHYTAIGFNALNIARLFRSIELRNKFHKYLYKAYRTILRRPFMYPYSKALKNFTGDIDSNINIFPTLIPNWDHTPRSGLGGLVLTGSSPALFKKHIKQLLEKVKNKPETNRILFLKSWNEWGEGNYVEPDLKYGHSFLNAIKECLAND